VLLLAVCCLLPAVLLLLCCCLFGLLQNLSDQEKIQHCRAVAERGLSDLMAYCKMSSTADGGNYSINLKGATG
jgi:hypothetical protein